MKFIYSTNHNKNLTADVKTLAKLVNAAATALMLDVNTNDSMIFYNNDISIYIKNNIGIEVTDDKPYIKVGDQEPYYSDNIGVGSLKYGYIKQVNSTGRYFDWVPVILVAPVETEYGVIGNAKYRFEVYLRPKDLELPLDGRDPEPEGTWIDKRIGGRFYTKARSKWYKTY